MNSGPCIPSRRNECSGAVGGQSHGLDRPQGCEASYVTGDSPGRATKIISPGSFEPNGLLS